jgi:hypothetical protein
VREKGGGFIHVGVAVHAESDARVTEGCHIVAKLGEHGEAAKSKERAVKFPVLEDVVCQAPLLS